MGKTELHAIIVTLGPGALYLKGEEFPEKVRQKAVDIFGEDTIVSNDIIRSPYEGYQSFYIAPDGGKEGWPESDLADKKRMQFLAWCDTQTDEDGGPLIRYGEVVYGFHN